MAEEKAKNSEIIRKDLIERDCMELRPETKEKMKIRTRKKIEIRKIGVEKARSKTRVAQEYHALRSPKVTNYIGRYSFLVRCDIFDLETPCYPRTYTHPPRWE